jgi:NAD-dependent deacetylase
MQVALDRVRGGDDDPPCLLCGGVLKSATISFGQSLDPDSILAAEEAALDCDLLLAVGTTLGVYPVAGIVPLALRHGARLVIVNAEATAFDDLADVVVTGSISEVLPRLVAMKLVDPSSRVSESRPDR